MTDDQPDLFSSLRGPGRARNADPDTSKAAAWSDLPRKATQRRTILAVHFRHAHPNSAYQGGLTDDEVQALIGLRLNSLTTRRSELASGGWLYDTGIRRRTTGGVEAVVWGMTEAAKERYRQAVSDEEGRRR